MLDNGLSFEKQPDYIGLWSSHVDHRSLSRRTETINSSSFLWGKWQAKSRCLFRGIKSIEIHQHITWENRSILCEIWNGDSLQIKFHTSFWFCNNLTFHLTIFDRSQSFRHRLVRDRLFLIYASADASSSIAFFDKVFQLILTSFLSDRSFPSAFAQEISSLTLLFHSVKDLVFEVYSWSMELSLSTIELLCPRDHSSEDSTVPRHLRMWNGYIRIVILCISDSGYLERRHCRCQNPLYGWNFVFNSFIIESNDPHDLIKAYAVDSDFCTISNQDLAKW